MVDSVPRWQLSLSWSIHAVRPTLDCRSDDTAFKIGTFSWQDPVHSWKAGPGEVMTVENLLSIHLQKEWGHYNSLISAKSVIYDAKAGLNS